MDSSVDHHNRDSGKSSLPKKNRGRRKLKRNTLRPEYLGKSSDTTEVKEVISRLPIPVLLNLVCCVLLFGYTQTSTSAAIIFISLLFLLTRSSAIVLFANLRRSSYTLSSSFINDTAQYIELLSMPILAFLTTILAVIRPDLELSSLGILAHATAQAVCWCATIHLIRAQLVNTVANLDTVVQSAQLSFRIVGTSVVASAVAVLTMSITQSVVILRPSASARGKLYFLAMTFIVALWVHEDPRLLSDTSPSSSGTFLHGHPIENLITAKRAHLDTMLARQSRTIQEATKEYQRRYHRRPPLGFDKWFELAQENNFLLVDEFDTFMQSIEPFHGVHPEVLQRRIDKVLKHELGRVGEITFKDRKATMSEGITGLFEKLMPDQTWSEMVPYNMTVLVNEWDESMVSVSFDEVAKALTDARDPYFASQKADLGSISPLPFIDTAKQNGWAATAHACSIYSPSRQYKCPRQKLSTPLRFVENATSSKEVCQNCDLLQDHGLLVSPDSFKVAHELVPIWSASKPSHFHDILYPSAYYIGVRGDYKSDLDSHWDDKDNKFYWVGTATGGWATEETWPLMQRQRLVMKTNKTSTEPIQLLEETAPGKWQPRFSTMAEISDLFVTRIASVMQCDIDACNSQMEAFGLTEDTPRDPQDAAYSHKFVLDIDGNGFSGRYYRLLQSRSVVVKQTILKEWHDDRLIPWVHYVPLSTGYTELPELARFPGSTERGLQLSERVARESTQWHNKVLRDVDLRLVWLRMMLEFGRVMKPELTM